MNTTPNSENNDKKQCIFSKWACCGGLMWWFWLFMAVMVVPLIGASLALALTANSTLQMVIFVVACWISVWFGMRLMKGSVRHHQGK